MSLDSLSATSKLRYNYRFYPSKPQRAMLARTFGCCRVVWNDALRFCRDRRRQGEKIPKNGDLQKQFITQAKRSEERLWLSEVSYVALQQSLRDLDVSYSRFFGRLKKRKAGAKTLPVGPPRMKKRTNDQSFRLPRGGFSIKPNDKGDRVYLSKIGEVDVQWSRPLPAVPSSVTVIKDAGDRYFLSFVVDVVTGFIPHRPDGKTVGIDLGITTFATLSTGEKIEAPKPLKANLKKLARFQRKLARKTKGSKRREKARLRVARLHSRIADIRNDFLHKLSSRLVYENQVIKMEDLNVVGMVKNHCLSRAISDLGWRKFRDMLAAKCGLYGRQFELISRWEPTSQTCSNCGESGGRKGLNIRAWQCLSCGAFHDRDINAAINIEEAPSNIIVAGYWDNSAKAAKPKKQGSSGKGQSNPAKNGRGAASDFSKASAFKSSGVAGNPKGGIASREGRQCEAPIPRQPVQLQLQLGKGA